MVVAEARQATYSMFSRAQRLLDRVVTPETRGQFYSNISAFANEHPFLATFIAFQILLSFTPLALFAAFVIGTLLFSLFAALVFSLFWTGVALLVLIPTLFITVPIGVFLWVSATTSFLAARWLYNVLPFVVREERNGKGITIMKEEKRSGASTGTGTGTSTGTTSVLGSSGDIYKNRNGVYQDGIRLDGTA
ncbi:hypothetical protein F5884DRAFT_182918 [Xylogone sp. PMI_703]|nr:hypothetical protein F5884DRAFT_182918 [Xylogone sp. PMI_703]